MVQDVAPGGALKSALPFLILALIIGGALYYISNTQSEPAETPSPVAEQKAEEPAAEQKAEEPKKENEQTNSNTNSMDTAQKKEYAVLETTKGTIKFELYAADAPKTVNNFVTLANKGFYNGVIFHRVIRGFMIQGGDPTGTGTGGPGYKFEDELNPATESYKAGYKRGVVAMANAGPNTNGSQFFIMHQDYPLPNNYSIFGKVVSGMEVVDAIAITPTDSLDRPLAKMEIKKASIVEE
jgi:cyclophilin family peptidyl-prolyl cis-trans isomerase